MWKAIFASLAFVDRYQRFSKEWNQVARIRSVKGKYQFIIANAETHEPIDILPNRRKETIHHYLSQYGLNVKMVVMDMSPAFKLHKDKAKLTKDELWYLERYTSMSSELKEAYELKELYKKWQRDSKEEKDFTVVKTRLLEFYPKVEETQNLAFLKVIKTFKNWQVEILNSYVFGYSNGFLEGINNTSKVKRNAYGFRKHEF